MPWQVGIVGAPRERNGPDAQACVGHGRDPDPPGTCAGDDVTAMKRAVWKHVLSDERELRGWTGFGLIGFAAIRISFEDAWGRMERAETDGRREYAKGRGGGGAPGPGPTRRRTGRTTFR